MFRYNLKSVSVDSCCRNTHNRFTLSVLCVKAMLANLVQATTDGSEQAQRHDEGPNQRNDPGRFM